MDIEGILEHVGPDLEKVREMINSSLSSDIELLNKTNGYLLGNPGKMIRPILSLLVAGACSRGHLTEDSLRFAAASELIHNATLLHDDVADDSPQRRGRPTVMSILGSRASVLLGDFWLVRAMERILQSDCNTEAAMRIFSHTLSDLAEGEMLQLQKAENADTQEVDYYRIIHDKTASLFEATAVTAAMSVGSSRDVVRSVTEFARHVGLAFQIRDDIMDYTGDGSIGKPVGQDLLEQKITLPLLGALANVPSQEAEGVRGKVKKIFEHPEYQKDIVTFVKENKGLEYAEERLHSHVDMAVIRLRELPDGTDRECLKSLAGFMAERKK